MRSTFLASVSLLSRFAVSYTVDPPTTADPGTIQDCTSWAIVTSSDTCQSLADYYFITLSQFDTYVSVPLLRQSTPYWTMSLTLNGI